MTSSMGMNMYLAIYSETNNRHRFHISKHILVIKNNQVAVVGYSRPIKV